MAEICTAIHKIECYHIQFKQLNLKLIDNEHFIQHKYKQHHKKPFIKLHILEFKNIICKPIHLFSMWSLILLQTKLADRCFLNRFLKSIFNPFTMFSMRKVCTQSEIKFSSNSS